MINVQFKKYPAPKLWFRDKIKFGKFKGHTLNWLVKHAPRYVEWLYEKQIIRLTDRGVLVLENSCMEKGLTPTVMKNMIGKQMKATMKILHLGILICFR